MADKEGSRKRKNLRPLYFFLIFIIGLFLIYTLKQKGLIILDMIFLCAWVSILIYISIKNDKTRHSEQD